MLYLKKIPIPLDNSVVKIILSPNYRVRIIYLVLPNFLSKIFMYLTYTLVHIIVYIHECVCGIHTCTCVNIVIFNCQQYC